MKKIQSIILALAMLLSLVPMSVSAEGTGLVIDENFEITDTAYSPSLGYVVAARDYTRYSSSSLPTRVYTSQDGITWSEGKGISDAYNSANRYSRQQLVWWEAANMFMFANGKGLMYSTDLSTWTQLTTNESARGNGIVEVEGDVLVSSGGRASKYVTPSNYKEKVQHYCFAASTPAVNDAALGITPADGDGNKMYMHITNNKETWLHSSSILTGTNAEVYGSVTKISATGAYTDVPVDVKYAPGVNGWVVIDGTTTLYTVTTAGVIGKITTPEADANVTALETNGNTVIIGTSTGKLYSASAENGLSADTVWTEVSGTGITDELRSISYAADGTYIAASKTAVYKISTNNGVLSYDIFKVEVPKVLKIGQPSVATNLELNAFEGTWVLGGVYSADLGMYAVYGNTRLPSEGDYGRIYTSKNGLQWKLALKSQVCFNTASSNAAVWWPKAVKNEDESYSGAFVISCATNQKGDGKVSSAGWYSTDGVQWSYTDAFGLCSDGDIAVSGDYLYTPADTRVIKKISALDKATSTAVIEEIAYPASAKVSKANLTYARKLAVSNDGRTFLIGVGNGNYITQWTIGDETAYDANANISSSMLEGTYDSNLGYFVVSHSAESAMYGLLGTERKLTWRPFTATGSKIITFAKSGDKYVIGRADGGVYMADKALTNTSTATEIVAEGTKNTLRIRDMVAGADGKVIAIGGATSASAGDVLLIDVAEGSYKKASESIAATADAQDEITVSIPYKNTTNETVDAQMIIAAYKGSKLVCVSAKNVQLGYQEEYATLSSTLTLDETAPDGCSLKVMLWDAAQAPLIADITPVFN